MTHLMQEACHQKVALDLFMDLLMDLTRLI